MIKTCRIILTSFVLLLSASAVQAQVTFTNGNATMNWADALNWSGGALPLATDNVIFNSVLPTTAGTVTLGTGSLANSLQFISDFIHATAATSNLNQFTLTGGDLTLTNGLINTSTSARAVINSTLLGAGGLTKTGSGSLVLGGSNGYSGTTTINGGVVTLTNALGFGSDPSTVVVNGAAVNGGGALAANSGNLTLAGSYAGGINLARNLSLNGNGAYGNGPSLFSANSNTVSGNITVSPGGLNDTTITSGAGTLNLTGGTLTLADTTARNLIFTGNGNTVIGDKITSGAIVDILIKQGNGGMAITNLTNDYAGNFRVDAGSIRFTDNAQLGGGTSAAKLNLTAGVMEFRTDAPNFGTVAKATINGNTTVFADHSATGMSTAINQTVALNAFTLTANRTLTVNTRNGYGVSFSSVVGGNLASNNTFTNNGNGLVTYTGNMWANTNTSASRTLTINGTGNTTITGGVTATSNVAAGVLHILTKAGAGTLTIQGTASTYGGATNIQAGTLAINDFRSITNNSSTITLGTAATAGTLNITGNNVAAAFLTTNKQLDLAGTGGGGVISANQTGTSPAIIFNLGVTASGAGAKSLTLSGANTLSNEIKGAIVDSATPTTSLIKTEGGTWRLSGANTYTGGTTISGGILQIAANAAASTVLADSGAITFGNNATTFAAGGTLEFVGQAGTTNVENVGALTLSAGAGTVKLTPGSGGGIASLTFSSLVAPTVGTGLNIQGATPTSKVTLTGQVATTATTLPGTAHIYYGGNNFAISDASGVLSAPTYAATGNFQTAASALASAVHNQVTGNFSNGALTVSSLKMTANTLTMTGALAVSTGGILEAGGTSSINGAFNLTSAATDLVVRVDGAGDILNLGMNLSGTYGLTKNGAGTLVLSGVNAQTGAVNINEGTVKLSGVTSKLSGNLATATATNIRQGATLDLNGVSTGTSIAQFNGAGTVTNSGAAATLTQGNNNGTGTFSGIIQDGTGALSFTKTGTGALNLNGSSSYTGVTTIAGTTGLISTPLLANIGSNSGIGKGVATDDTTNAASLVFAGTTGGINYTGTTSVSTNRLFTLNGSAASSGGQIANSSGNNSTLIFSNTAPIAFGTNAAATPQILTLGGASTGDNTFNPRITDNGANITTVNKIGVGTWVLGGLNNTYTGATNVQAGFLRIGDDSGAGTTRTLSPNSPLTLGATTVNGVLESNGLFTRPVATPAVAGTGSVTWTGTTGGGGFAAVGSKLTVNLGGAGGTLTWGSGGFVPTGAPLILGSANALGEVEFQNGIDLGTAARTIQADDNGNTGFDISTISGVITGGAGGAVSKTGTGTLQLTGANTYIGNTTVAAGTLVISSLGNSSGTTSSSVGASGGSVLIGNATTTGGTLTYVGSGEVSSRLIQLNTTTAGVTIESNGSGPMILTNLQNNLVGGAKTLTLRGFNLDGNEISSVLADNGGILTLAKSDYGTWILSAANTYTGNTSITGPLGIGNDAAFGTTGAVTLNVASLFSVGGAHTIANAVSVTTNTTNQIFGDNSLTMNGSLTVAGGANTNTYVNNLPAGKTWTIAGTFSHNDTTTKPQSFGGSGATLITGQITNTAAGLLAITVSGSGTNTLTLGNSGTANDYRGVTTITSGTLVLGDNEQIPNGMLTSGGVTAVAAGNLVMSPGVGQTARLNLNGKAETINGLTGTVTTGTMLIDNNAATAASLTVGDGDNTSIATASVTTYNGSITRSGGGALTLGKTGLGIATFNGPVDVTAINVGAGSLKLNSTTGMTTAVGNAMTSVTVDAGGLLNLYDGFGVPFSNLTSLSLGNGANAGAANTILELEAGDAGIDALITSLTANVSASTLAGQIILNIRDAGLSPSTSYTLISAPGGLLAGGAVNFYALGALGGYAGSSITQTDTSVILNVGTVVAGNMYYTGLTDAKWNSVDPSFNGVNWSSTKDGLTMSTTVPGAGTNVVFSGDNAAGGGIATTLEQSFRINSLVTESSTTTSDFVTIAPGALTTNRLTLAPSASTAGIEMKTGGPKSLTISAPLTATGPQTWQVADNAAVTVAGITGTAANPILNSTSTAGLAVGMQITGPGIPAGTYITAVDPDGTHFTVSTAPTAAITTAISARATQAIIVTGGLAGSGSITKDGPGKLVLTGSGSTYTGAAFTVNNGSVEITNTTALGGTAVAGVGTPVSVNTGGTFYYSNTTAGTVSNPLTLNGGTLAAANNGHTYSGNINMAADSIVSTRDQGAIVGVTRAITLSGVISGAGKMTINGNTAVATGSSVTNTVVLSNANPAWSGGILIQQGTVDARTATSMGTGAVTVNLGRILFKGATNTTWSQFANGLTVDNPGANAVVELQPDNQGTTGLFTTDITGTVTLGSATSPAFVRLFQADTVSNLNISGNVVMNNNTSFHTSAAAAGNTAVDTISGVISQVGGPFTVTINGDTVWASNNFHPLLFSGANTFTAPILVQAGTLQFTTVENNGSLNPNSLGMATDGLTLGALTSGGTLAFVGSTSQTTDRAITLGSTTAATSALTASGTSGAAITYTGAINGGINALTLDGTGIGNLNGVFSQAGNATSDLNKNGSGTWNLNATNVIVDDLIMGTGTAALPVGGAGTLNINITQQITDDVIVNGTGTVLNLNAANSLQGDDLFIRGGVVNLGINGALNSTLPNGMDALVISDTLTAPATAGGMLDLKGFTSTVGAVTIGLENTIDGFINDSVGGGALTAASYTVRHGGANAVLAGTAATLAKNGAGTFTLSGANTFGGVTTVTEGNLVLDYSVQNNSKIASAVGVVMGAAGGLDANARLTFNSNASATSTQAFTTLTVNAGSNDFIANSVGGQAMNVNFTTITRGAGGTIDFTVPAVGGITTTAVLNNGIIGGYATVGNGSAFATKDGSNVIGALVPTLKTDISTWALTDNVVDDAGGFLNSITTCNAVNSVTFTGANSLVNSTGLLGINTGGVLVKSGATGDKILGGVLTSGASDIIVHQYATGDFQITSQIKGANAITKTGPGGLVLTNNANTFTGALNITEGLVKVSGGNAIGDAATVTLKDVAGVGLTLQGSETIGGLTGGGLVGGNVAIGTNTLTVNNAAANTFDGLLSGNGTFIKTGAGNFNFDVSSNTGFTGSLVINQGLIFLSGNGIVNMPTAASVTANQGGAFLIDFNSGTTGSNRINDTAPITLSSLGNGTFFGVQVRSNQAASFTETMGALTLAGSASSIGITSTSGGAQSVNAVFASLTRQNNATVFIDGANLSVATGNNRSKVTFTAALTNVGGTGLAGAAVPATNVPIVRFGTSLQTGAAAVADVPNTFFNYNTTTGVTPLNIATEYVLDAAGYAASADATNNLRFTAGATGLTVKEFNAIVFDSTAAAMTVSGTAADSLTVGSGAMLFTSTVPANGTTLDTFASIIPGANSGNEFIITAAGTTATIGSVLAEGAGTTTLTKSGSGTLVLSGVNTYSGATVFNQGIVSASTTANLGTGVNGGLTFNGGTLQFGGVFDPSVTPGATPRTVTINGVGSGGTFDTNGNNIVIANSIGNGGTGSLNKTGAGNLTINSVATYTGTTTILNGTLTAGVANVVPATSNVTVNGATATLDLAAFNLSVNTLTLTAGAINGSGTLTANSYQVAAGTIANTLTLAGSGGITKTTAGDVILGNSASSFTGQTIVQGGTLSFDSIANANGTPSALGAPANAVTGAIQMGLTTAATGLTYTGTGHSTDRRIDLVGTTGATTVNANGTGALVLNGAVTSMEFGTKNFVLNGTASAALINKVTTPITECLGTINLLKQGVSTWQLDASNTYKGSTSVDQGKLTINAVQNMSGALNMGSANTITTAGTLELLANATFTSMLVQTNSATEINHLVIPAANTLTINGNTTIGGNGANSTTLLDSSGGGSLVVSNPAASSLFAVGGNVATGNKASADLSGLGSVTIALDPATGIVRVNPNNATNVNDKFSTLILPSTGSGNTTITANILAVGDSGQNSNSAGQVNTLKLGTGSNTINVNTVNIGTGIRDVGSVVFNQPSGTVTLRAANGTGPVAFNMGTGTAVTAVVGNANNFDVTGHSADLLFGAVAIGTQNRSGDLTNTFAFDTGTLSINSLTMSTKGTNGFTTTSTMNLGGGTVNIGSGSGTAITLATNTGPGTANATINITGTSVVTMTGNIVKGANTGAGTSSGIIDLNGGTLNMSGNSMGTSTNLITFKAESGTLQGLGELNGGGALSKISSGTLTLKDGNTYTGNTLVGAGVLVAENTTGSATGLGGITVDPLATLAGGGAITPATDKNIDINGILKPGTLAAISGTDLSLSLSGTGALKFGAGSVVEFNLFSNLGTGTLNPASANTALIVGAANWTNVLIDPTSTLRVTAPTISTWTSGDSWKIFDWTGILAGIPLTAPSFTLDLPSVSGATWDTSKLFTTGEISIGIVPEPGRVALLAIGFGMIGFRRRRKQA